MTATFSGRADFYRHFAGSAHRRLVEAHFRSLGDPPSSRPPAAAPESVLLCFTNRCGSTLVAARMAARGLFGPPNASGNYEYFNGDEVVDYCKANAVRSFADYVSAAVGRFCSPAGHFASKIAVDQLAWLTETGIIGSRLRNPRFVHVTRTNLVAQAVSLAIALQTRQWTSLHPATGAIPSFNPNQIATFVADLARQNAQFDTYFRLHGIRPLTIVYEQVADAPEALTAILDAHFGEAHGLDEAHRANVLPVDRQAGPLNEEWEREFRALQRRGESG